MTSKRFLLTLARRAFTSTGPAWDSWALRLAANDPTGKRTRMVLADVQEASSEQCPGYKPLSLGGWTVSLDANGQARAQAAVPSPAWQNTSGDPWAPICGMYVTARIDNGAEELTWFVPVDSLQLGAYEPLTLEGNVVEMQWGAKDDGQLVL